MKGKKKLNKQYYTITEVSEIMDTHRHTIWRLVTSGKLPALKLNDKPGSMWFIHRDDIPSYAKIKQK